MKKIDQESCLNKIGRDGGGGGGWMDGKRKKQCV